MMWFGSHQEDPDPEGIGRCGMPDVHEDLAEIMEEVAAENLQDLLKVLRRIRDDETPGREMVVEAVRRVWEEE